MTVITTTQPEAPELDQSGPSRHADTDALLKLYIFDCGKIDSVTAEEFGFKAGEIATEMTTPCYLVVHPRGALLWDTGEIPDSEIAVDGAPTRKRTFTSSRKLTDQLQEVGYSPDNIDFLAFSHYHNDHVANANLFSGSTWLVQRAEHEAMFDPSPDFERFGPVTPDQKFFCELKNSETILIENCDHDVFGDGRVIIKFTPGHTAGHQSLFLDLDETGPVLITGDMYHYYNEVNRPADFVNHVSNPLTTLSRQKIEAFAQEVGAELWIPHDIVEAPKFRLAPEYYR